MAGRIDLQGSTVLNMANKVAKVCTPLRNLNIVGFQYMRRFSDGSRYILCDCPQLMQYFYEEGFYPLTWYDNNKPITSYRPGVEFWPMKSLYNTREQVFLDTNLFQLFKIAHSITYLEKNQKFLEIFRFFSNDNLIYLLDRKIFYHFMFYFKDNMQKYISRSREDCFKVPLKLEPSEIVEAKADYVVESLPIKKYYLKGKYEKVYLTCSERNCLNWCIQGKTSAEIGLILGISKRTVENNIQKIKEKFDCYKQSQLVTLAIKQGICSV